jgi:hypothetical protein
MAPVYKTEINSRGNWLRWPRDTPLTAKIGIYFANKPRHITEDSILHNETCFKILQNWVSRLLRL